MKESRLFKIIYYLLEKGGSTAPELAEKFEVSIRTIYRDIDVISSAGIPIYATQGKGGGIFILKDFVLDKSLFSEDEQEQLMMALQGIHATKKDDNEELLTKLSALFQNKASNWIEVDYTDWFQAPLKEDVFDTIKQAIFLKHTITFSYFNQKGEQSNRHIQPLKLIFKGKDWYVYGYCLEKKAERFFKLTRIKQLAITEQSFPHREVERVIPKQLSTEHTISVTLKFNKEAAFRVYDEFPEEVTVSEDGYLYVKTRLPMGAQLFSYLFSFMEEVEVIEPVWLREKMLENIEKMKKIYRT